MQVELNGKFMWHVRKGFIKSGGPDHGLSH